MQLRVLPLLLAVVVGAPACKPPPAPTPTTAATALPLTAAPAAPVLVYLVRHAEKAVVPGDDPPLSKAGTERAEALDAMLAHAGVTHIFATQYGRTLQTIDPLARRQGLVVETIKAGDDETQLDALRALPGGSVAVVAGHSNTIPGLVRKLGGQAPDLTDTQYDRLFLVALVRTATATRATSTQLRYGYPSPD